MKRFIPLTCFCALLALGAGCTKESKKARFVHSGDKSLAAGRYDKAEVEYLNAVRLDPRDAVLLGRLGTMYMEQGRYERAFSFLRTANEQAPDLLEVRFLLGQLYFSGGQAAKAREELSAVLAKEPAHREAVGLLAELASAPAERKQLRDQLEALRKTAGEKAPFHVGLGVLSLRENDRKTAEAEFKQALSLDPKLVTAHLSLGLLSWQNGDLPTAERELKAASGLSPVRSLRRLKLVEFYLKTGKVEEGRKLLDELVKQAPDYILAWKQIAELQLRAKEFDACLNSLIRVKSLEPIDSEAGMLSARLRLSQGKAPEAVQELEAVRGRNPQRPDVYHQLALAYLANNEPNKAVASLQRAVTLNTNLYEPTLLLADLRTRQGDHAGSIQMLSELLKKRPNDEMAQYLLAAAYNARGTPDDALAIYRGLLRSYPKNPRAALLMGMVLRQQNNAGEARKAFDTVLELAPDSPEALFQLVELDIQEKNFDGALQRVRRVIEAKPKAAEFRVLESKVYLAQGDLVQAEAAMRKCLELAPDSSEAYNGLAQILLQAKKTDLAMEELAKASAKNPKDTSASMLMGTLLESKGEYAKARDMYEKVLAINPQHVVALNNLAYIYSVRLKDLDKALALAQKARQLMANSPAAAVAADTLGWVTFLRGDYPGALVLLQESAAKLTEEPEVQYHLGMGYYMMGQEAQARAALQRAAGAEKEFVGKEEAKSKLALLGPTPGKSPEEMIQALERTIAQHDKDVPLLLRLCALYEQRGMSAKAQELAEKILEINPKNVRAMLVLARAYGARPDGAPKALEYAKNARAEAPNDPEVAHAAGRAAFQVNQHDWAYSILQEGGRTSADPEYQYDYAWAAYSVGKVAEAETALQTALRQNPNFSRAEPARRFLDMLTLIKAPAQIPQATPRIQEALKADPNYVPGLMASSAAWQLRGGHAEARKIYERVLALYPHFSPAMRNLAILYADHEEDPQKGYEMAVKARRDLPDDAELAKALGKLAYRRNEYQYAVQLLTESQARQKADAELYFYLGMSQYRLKQKTESAASLRQAMAMNLDAKLGEEAKRVLAEK